MPTLLKSKKAFVSRFSKYILGNIGKKKVYGVSLLPISIEKGKRLISLGKERDGIFMDQFNYFGGKIEDKINDLYSEELEQNSFNQYSLIEKSQIIAEVLFEETYEEFGIVLNSRKFKKCFLSIIHNPYKDGVSLLFACHITNINPSDWTAIMKQRVKKYKYLPWNLQEMSRIKNIDIDDLKNVSYYVSSSCDKVLPCYTLLTKKNRVEYNEFRDTREFNLNPKIGSTRF